MLFKSLLINLGLSLTSVLIFFGGVELTARLAWPGGEDLVVCSTPHPRLVWARKPMCDAYEHKPESTRHEYHFDSCAQRNLVPCERATVGSLRIAAIGDSMTEGALVGVEEIYVNVAARVLAQLGKPVFVGNFAVSGWDLLQYSERLEDALKSKPDVVVVGVVSNDLFDDPSPEGLEVLRRALVQRGAERLMRDRVDRWHNETLLATIRSLLNRSRAVIIVQHYLFRSDSAYIGTYLARGAYGNYLAREYTQEWVNRVEGGARLLQSMAERSQAAGARFVVVLIPQRVQAVMLGMKSSLPQEFEPSGLQRRLREKLGGVDVLDFLEVLEKTERPGDLYFPVDGHLTPVGQRVLGEALGRHLATSLGS